ncbi:hypothetical protein ABRZ24_13895 [Brenneria populi]|uniref:N-acetyltransferase n=1 Tax=Brenneria populi TaxID=1505588 RepID=A0ABU6JSE4_9GAMM|nr:hypothetical protein [Brenneria populi Li et al. 2015]
MNFEQIGILTLNNVQMLLEQANLPLAVGPITDADFQALSTNYAELNWDFAFSTYGNDPNKFEFCIKLIGEANPLPSGASICIYDIQNNSLDIMFVESFVRNIHDHPLHGHMIEITLMAAYIFCSAVDCDIVNVIEPVNIEVMALYERYGFEGDSDLMSASRAKIRESVMRYY